MQTAPNKRIVSKGAYAANVGNKYTALLVGMVFLAVGIFFAVATYDGLIKVWAYSGTVYTLMGEAIPILGVAACGLLFCLYCSYHTVKDFKRIDPGIPLTRANTGDLPAPDSLVRASQEPAQAQETVLLRAAAGEGQETPPEQLVRAVETERDQA